MSSAVGLYLCAQQRPQSAAGLARLLAHVAARVRHHRRRALRQHGLRLDVRPRRLRTANRHVRGFGWEIAHAAVSRRTPIPLDTMAPRTGATRTTLGFGICPSCKVHSLSRRAKP
jgi:hypothetical protein